MGSRKNSVMSKRCDHSRGNIQQFTEVCLDCGHNIYETDEEYIAGLEEEIRQRQHYLTTISNSKKIKVLEQELDELDKQIDAAKDPQ